MKALTAAIYEKLSGSDLEGYVSNRFYKMRAPFDVEYPYIVFKLLIGNPEYTFVESYEDVTIQFDIFSKKTSTDEVENIYTALTDLYDNAILIPTNERVLNCQRSSQTLINEEHTTETAEEQVYHYAIDYEIYLERS